jgi:hypothetical protein
MLACTKCGDGQVPNDEGNDCVCPATSRSAGLRGPLVCIDCAKQNLDVTLDGMFCTVHILKSALYSDFTSAHVLGLTFENFFQACEAGAMQPVSLPANLSLSAMQPVSLPANLSLSAVFPAAVVSPVCAGGTQGAKMMISGTPAPAASSGSAASTPSSKCSCPVGYAISDVNATGQLPGAGGKLCFLCPV